MACLFMGDVLSGKCLSLLEQALMCVSFRRCRRLFLNLQLPQSLGHLSGVQRGIDIIVDLSHHQIGIKDKRPALCHVQQRHLDAIGLRDFGIWIGQQREREPVFAMKGLQGFYAIRADTENFGTLPPNHADRISKRTCLRRATWGSGFRVEYNTVQPWPCREFRLNSALSWVCSLKSGARSPTVKSFASVDEANGIHDKNNANCPRIDLLFMPIASPEQEGRKDYWPQSRNAIFTR